MKATIIKSSNKNYFQPCVISMEGLKKLINLTKGISIHINYWKNESVENIMKFSNVVDREIAKWISEADYEIIVPNDYNE